MTTSLMSRAGWPTHLRRRHLYGLYVITENALEGGHLGVAQAALEGGARIIQLRAKELGTRDLVPLARAVRDLCHAHGAVFIVNDAVEVALASGADGVHLGPEDLPWRDARRLLGPHLILGASCDTPDEARAATAAGANYVAAGAIYATSSKSDAGAAIGLEGLCAIREATPLPVAAIGGLTPPRVAEVVAAGAAMACVISAVTHAGSLPAMTAATRALVHAGWPGHTGWPA